MKIGILAIQGSIAEHKEMFDRLGVETILVKKPNEIDKIDGLILPGGESTTFLKVLENRGLFEKLREKIFQGLPILATCAGIIILAKDIENYPEQKTLGVLDITVSRNAYGRQKESFITYIDIPILGNDNFEAIFIRAPQIKRVGEEIKVHAYFDGNPVFIEKDNLLGLTFHPELTEDARIHKYFITKYIKKLY
ncbi:MAG: pyridoxal 5'-phosphate synthase glutaminase subunit PdxT [bacterium]